MTNPGRMTTLLIGCDVIYWGTYPKHSKYRDPDVLLTCPLLCRPRAITGTSADAILNIQIVYLITIIEKKEYQTRNTMMKLNYFNDVQTFSDLLKGLWVLWIKSDAAVVPLQGLLKSPSVCQNGALIIKIRITEKKMFYYSERYL